MNRFIGSLPIVTTLSYHNFKIAVTITHKQLQHSPDAMNSSTVELPSTTLLLTDESLTNLLNSFIPDTGRCYIASARIQQKHSLYCWRSLFTEPFPSNRSPQLRRGPHIKRLRCTVERPCMLDCLQRRCLATL
jgi:hypothetical protein